MRPAFLHSGDTIALICTARWLTSEQCRSAVDVFAQQGFVLEVAPHATTKHAQLAGDRHQRSADLLEAIADPEVKAIVVGRGGYGTVQLLDRLDMPWVARHPKWMLGFSDVTALLAHWNSHGCPAIHAPMPVQFDSITESSLASVFAALKGDLRAVQWNGMALGLWPWQQTAMLYGGNLSVICSLLDSASWQPKEPFFLMIEDIDEMVYHLDRMLHAIARARSSCHLLGVLVGGLTDFRDNTKAFGFATDNGWGASPMEVVENWSQTFEIPVITGLPVGHQAQNHAMYLGERAKVIAMGQNHFQLEWAME